MMKTATVVALLLFGTLVANAQRWQGQVGTNLATWPGRSLELTSAWSPNLNRWALTFHAGYSYKNAWSAMPSGLMCDCGIEDLKTSGAFFKAGYRFDPIRQSGRATKVGFPIGVNLIGSQYRQEGTIESFPSGTSIYRSESVSGFLMGLGLTAAMNIRFSDRWNLDLGIQKFFAFRNRTDYFLFKSFRSHQPGVGLLNSKNSWPGLQGIVGLNYRLGRL
ncbi:DUF3575 domain-containing protein [Larkinella terrae]|uniref:DUF3575 domain-containing protein n=1 Tax=Larkinella terrae TaxID=2025311 RepID=A0A7K0EM53_9BACT|nr:DUF3575 domain-containing protein [Larkinella terrae]MRS62889.1 DUF3575 domain-containing protein [Larkinella terrae]